MKKTILPLLLFCLFAVFMNAYAFAMPGGGQNHHADCPGGACNCPDNTASSASNTVILHNPDCTRENCQCNSYDLDGPATSGVRTAHSQHHHRPVFEDQTFNAMSSIFPSHQTDGRLPACNLIETNVQGAEVSPEDIKPLLIDVLIANGYILTEQIWREVLYESTENDHQKCQCQGGGNQQRNDIAAVLKMKVETDGKRKDISPTRYRDAYDGNAT